MNFYDLIGIAAGVMTVAIYLPQAVRTFRFRRDAHALRGLSIVAIGASLVEFVLWIVWGFGKEVPAGAIPYLVLLPIVATTFFLVLRAHLRERGRETGLTADGSAADASERADPVAQQPDAGVP
ncbi:MAG: hypothetical protein J7480_05120 [Microbacteriaceae bacterium]|nr:hypothetical protein [Microbacteriaceae bacterium]